MPTPTPLRILVYGTELLTGRLRKIATDALGQVLVTLGAGSYVNVGVDDTEFDVDQDVAEPHTMRVAIADDDTNLAPLKGTVETDRLAANPIVGQAGVTGGAGNVDDATQRTAEGTDSVLNTAIASVKAVAGAAAALVGQQLGGYASAGSPPDVDEGDLARLVTTLSGFLKIGSYVNATNVLRVIIENWPRYDAQVDELDVANIAADTYYYPSEDGLEMVGYNGLSIDLELAGGVIVTVEADGSDAAGASWEDDITQAFMNLVDNTTNNVTFEDVDAYLLAEGLNVTRIRIKYVTSDGTNAIKIVPRRIAA